jgi:RimJ/RimL family protein N-acetyltransferase
MNSTEVQLETDKVLLRPVEATDFENFYTLARDDMWTYFPVNLAEEKFLRQWMDISFRDRDAGTRIPFTIIEKLSGEIAGSMSLMNISLHDLRTEIGSSWLGKKFRSTEINFHSKYSMMRYAFEQMNFERVEFKTDVLNERAKNGLRKIGGKEEGILRSHMTMWNNRRRDSIYFSVIKNEWPLLKQTVYKDIEGYEFH